MTTSTSRAFWRCQCRKGSITGLCRMPPAPDVVSALFMEYRRKAASGVTFAQYLESIGFVDPSVDTVGMDDRVLAKAAATGSGVELISIPERKVQGVLKVMVLLVDFEDRPGSKEVGHYEDLLFSKDKHPTGSMRDYYAEVSRGKVDVVGSVHGWLRMPHPYSYYVNNASGTNPDTYPRNCKRLAEDAAGAALAAGVAFDSDLDKLGQGFVTALFIVHSGRGAEHLQTVAEQKQHIWSHKWNVEKPVEVASHLNVTTYLVVNQDCKVGVCAHELGHLAFQWQDFYDPNYKDDGEYWAGSGSWDLMASGSHNYGGARPAHPAGLHKMQHGWVPVQTVEQSTSLVIKPIDAAGGKLVKIRSNAFADDQYLLLENRRLHGFDKHLPGEGLLVWRVDESKEMFAPATPGLQLVQADGRQQLETPSEENQGDDSDPFPGSEGVTQLKETGRASTSFPGRKSGIVLSNIAVDGNGWVTLDVEIGGSGPVAAKATAKAAAKKTPAKKRPAASRKRPRG